MRNGKIFIVTIILLTVFFTHPFAQYRASSSVAATIVTPIGVSNQGDSTLGNNGSVILIPLLGYSSDYVKLATPGGSVVSAAYAIKDQGAYTYSITLPTTVYNGMNSLTVTCFTSTIAAKGINAKSSETLNIGVILKDANSKTGGITIPITVNYN